MAQPPKRRLLPHLTIRQKVLAATAGSIILFTVVGLISYSGLMRLESTLALTELADDLSNSILEIRRFEKNYLLYEQEEDFEAAQSYIMQARGTLRSLREFAGSPARPGILEDLRLSLDMYSEMAEKLHPGKSPASPQVRENLRQYGKQLVEVSLELKNTERDRSLILVAELKSQLFVSGLLLLSLGIGLAFLFSRKIIKALDAITQATRKVAEGSFKAFEVPPTGDETERVLEAFNSMARELERRQNQLLREKKLSSLGVLTSGIAHQLNNPLNNISTSCQILSEEFGQCDPDFGRKMLGNIGQEVARARDIVKGLLEFSRAGDFSPRPCSLSDIAAKALRLVSSQIPAGIETSLEIPENLLLNVDAARMQEVFINLFINSLQAIKNPPGRIKLSAQSDPVAGLAEITLEDSGPGIAPEDLGRIFDPFYTTKEVGKGTGLGLSIVFGIIEKHQGSIEAVDNAGRGAKFLIRLPFAEQAPALSGSAP